MSEKTAIKDVIKDLKTSLHAVDEKNNERYKELRKDLDVNVALCASTSNRVETLKAKKEDTDKLIDLTSQFNINVRNVQAKIDTIDRDYSILASKLDALSNTMTADFENERAYFKEQHSILVNKITALVNALDEKLTAEIQKVAEETVM